MCRTGLKLEKPNKAALLSELLSPPSTGRPVEEAPPRGPSFLLTLLFSQHPVLQDLVVAPWPLGGALWIISRPQVRICGVGQAIFYVLPAVVAVQNDPLLPILVDRSPEQGSGKRVAKIQISLEDTRVLKEVIGQVSDQPRDYNPRKDDRQESDWGQATRFAGEDEKKRERL
jgi:hypothetical protein